MVRFDSSTEPMHHYQLAAHYSEACLIQAFSGVGRDLRFIVAFPSGIGLSRVSNSGSLGVVEGDSNAPNESHCNSDDAAGVLPMGFRQSTGCFNSLHC
jgi:hypothetical protein